MTETETVVIDADRRISLGLGELWRGRELLLFLAIRQIRVTYQQSLLGIAWVIGEPLVGMGIFSLFFGNLAKLPTSGLPYAVFYVSGLVPYRYIRSAIVKSTASLVTNKPLVTKIYIPRILLPLAPIVSDLLDLTLGLLLVIVVMLVVGVPVAGTIIFLPLWVLLLGAFCLAIGLWLSSINAVFRDVGFIVGYVTQLLMFVTPVTYGIDLITDPRWQTIYYLNPFAAGIDGFRSSITGSAGPPAIAVSAAVALTVLLLLSGVVFFRRMESVVADAI